MPKSIELATFKNHKNNQKNSYSFANNVTQLIEANQRYMVYLNQQIEAEIQKLTVYELAKITAGPETNLQTRVFNKKISKTEIQDEQQPKNPREDQESTGKIKALEKKVDQLVRIKFLTLRLEHNRSENNDIKENELQTYLRPILLFCYLAKAEPVRHFAQTVLEKIKPGYHDFLREEALREFEFYYETRDAEAKARNKWRKFIESTHPFFAPHKEPEVKLPAADKMIRLLKGEKVDPFTTFELQALRDGRLGRIVAKYESVNVLPTAFHAQERELFASLQQSVVLM